MSSVSSSRGGDEPRVANLAPSAYVDSVAGWTLNQVVAHLRKKEREEKQEREPPVSCHARTCFVSFPEAISNLAVNYGIASSQMCRYLTYHGAAILSEDSVLQKMSSLYVLCRREALRRDDDLALGLLGSVSPYSPIRLERRSVHYPIYRSWVAERFRDMADMHGVCRYYLVQIAMVESMLSNGLGDLGATAVRYTEELSKWTNWAVKRLELVQEVAVRLGIE